MNIFTNPLFLTRLAGLIALAVTLYFPGANEDKISGLVVVIITFIAGKFERQPQVAKDAQAAEAKPTPLAVKK